MSRQRVRTAPGRFLRSGLATLALVPAAVTVAVAAEPRDPRAVPAYGPSAPEGATAGRRLDLSIGRSVVIDLPRDAKEVFVANPAVANAVVRSARKIFLIGMANGATSVFVMDASGAQIASLEVNVGRDLNILRTTLRQALPNARIEVRPAGDKGRGVFARRAIRKGEVIERVPLLVLSAEEYNDGPNRSMLAGYVFAWGDGQFALALGYGSIYNHSYRPNAAYEDEEPQAKRFVALRNIKAGEEVTVNYNGDPTSRVRMWFDTAREPKAKKAGTPRKADPPA